ncbi:hypothetical protein [Fulvivirga ligni]|uniref:hypothetical protein n=1 Tax=Fulvivirga ligni TaxID=2904246 RepID=UPI001F28459C|nr:hypothetical protein [Fulvivirga ligni]UII20454.1 hypothetical protein LVD16_21685 [Fulvivirga ligni]
MNEKKNIVFFSRSNEVFECLEPDLFQKWNFYLASPDLSSPNLDHIYAPSLIIVDTFSLGMDFLNTVVNYENFANVPSLVLDYYTEEPLINSILSNGAAGYLLVHSFSDELVAAINHMMEGKQYITNQIEVYKGNTYLKN